MSKLEGLNAQILEEIVKHESVHPYLYAGLVKRRNLNIKKQYITMPVIIDTVCTYFETTKDVLFSHTRKREIVTGRQLIHWYTKKYTTLSLATIGYITGKKDHATVLHSIRAINNLLETDKDIQQAVDTINLKLEEHVKTMSNIRVSESSVQSSILQKPYRDILSSQEAR